jgi:hypothetical protein
MCRPACCSMSWSRWAIRAASRRAPGWCAIGGCGRRVWCARRCLSGPRPRSTIPLGRRPSGTGSSCRARRGWFRARDAHRPVGSLSFSSQSRAVFADTEEQPQTIDGLARVSERLGGVSRVWRFDRMSTVVHVGTDRILASFAAVAKHYGVEVAICPPYRRNRKGVVESNIDLISQRWWRTADVDTVEQAQASLDAFCVRVGDTAAAITTAAHHLGRAGRAGRSSAATSPAVPGRSQRPGHGRFQRHGRVRREPLLGAAVAGRCRGGCASPVGIAAAAGDDCGRARGRDPSTPRRRRRGDHPHRSAPVPARTSGAGAGRQTGRWPAVSA